MRRMGNWWRLVGLVVVGALGCSPSYSDLRPNRPDDYKLPPEGLYTGEVTYPKELLNQTGPRKEKDSTDGLPPAQSGRMGSGIGSSAGRP